MTTLTAEQARKQATEALDDVLAQLGPAPSAEAVAVLCSLLRRCLKEK